jgi:hypothetical protein
VREELFDVSRTRAVALSVPPPRGCKWRTCLLHAVDTPGLRAKKARLGSPLVGSSVMAKRSAPRTRRCRFDHAFTAMEPNR